MKSSMAAVVLAALVSAAPVFAQESGATIARGYITGLGGFASSVGHTTGDMSLEAGVRVAPHLMVFGSVGHFGNLQSELQPTLDSTTTDLTASEGLTVVGSGTVPATYGQGGVRFDIPSRARVTPYVLGAFGVARLTPTPAFAFSDGVLPDGSTPAVGTDITSAIATAGLFTTPTPSTAALFSLGGGIQVPLAAHWMADAGYRFSRVASDTTLSTSALKTNGLAVGIGYRF